MSNEYRHKNYKIYYASPNIYVLHILAELQRIKWKRFEIQQYSWKHVLESLFNV